MSQLSQTTADFFARYEKIIQNLKSEEYVDPLAHHPRLAIENLLWMCQTGQAEHDTMPEDKASRWFGFVQGCLAMRDIIDVDEERDITRGPFHAARIAKGYEAPPIMQRPD